MERLLKIACDMFKTVLERDDHNLFAAHGIAAVLAEQATRAEPPRLEYLQAAKKVFDKVFKSCFCCPHVESICLT